MYSAVEVVKSGEWIKLKYLLVENSYYLLLVQFELVIREVLQTESGSVFRKVHVTVLTGQGQTYTRTCANRKFVLQAEDWFSVSFSVRPVQWRCNWGRSRRFWRTPCCPRVTKFQSGLGGGRTFLLWLALQGSAGRTDNQRGSSRRVKEKGKDEKEDYLYVDDSWRRLSSALSLSPSPSTFYDQNTLFSDFLTAP